MSTLQAQVRLGEELMREMETQLQWMKAAGSGGGGVPEVYGKKGELEQRRAQFGPIIEKLVGLVEAAQQPALRGMLEGR